MTSDSITQISKFPQLHFSARLSTFLYRVTSHIHTYIHAVCSTLFRSCAHLNGKRVFLRWRKLNLIQTI